VEDDYEDILTFEATTVEEFIDEAMERSAELSIVIMKKTMRAIENKAPHAIYGYIPSMGICLSCSEEEYKMVLETNMEKCEEIEEYELCKMAMKYLDND